MIQRTVFTPGSMPSKLRWWFLKTFTGHGYDQLEVDGKVHRFPHCFLVHGDKLVIDFTNARVTLENRWGRVTTTQTYLPNSFGPTQQRPWPPA